MPVGGMKWGVCRGTVLAFVFALLAACESETPSSSKVDVPTSAPSKTEVASEPEFRLVGDDSILVTVNGVEISAYDLERATVDLLGETQASTLDGSVRTRVLESLVTSRAIAQRQLESMDDRARAELEKRVQAYREQLLVKAYLKSKASPRPVTQAMVEDYYARHPEQFGARSLRSFEMLHATAVPDGSAGERLVSQMAAASEQTDWELVASALSREGVEVRHRSGRVDARLLDPVLHRALVALDVDQTSEVILVQGRPHLARVVSEQRVPPRPLVEVSAEIRKMLLPIRIREALEQVASTVLVYAKVVYAPLAGGPTKKGQEK